MQGVDWVLAAGCLALAMAAGPVWAGDAAIEDADGRLALQEAAPEAHGTAAGAAGAGMRIQWDPATGALAPAGAKSGVAVRLPRPDYGAVRPRLTARGHLEIPATVRMATVARLDADGALQVDCLQHGVAHAPHAGVDGRIATRPGAAAGGHAPAGGAGPLHDTGTEGR